MNAMKKILALALAGVMALALLTGCGTGGSASHKSIAKAMADYDNGHDDKTTITFTSSAELDAKLQSLAASTGFETVVKAVYESNLYLDLTTTEFRDTHFCPLKCSLLDRELLRGVEILHQHA